MFGFLLLPLPPRPNTNTHTHNVMYNNPALLGPSSQIHPLLLCPSDAGTCLRQLLQNVLCPSFSSRLSSRNPAPSVLLSKDLPATEVVSAVAGGHGCLL